MSRESRYPEFGEATLALRAMMTATHELTARASRAMGLNPTDVVALDLVERLGPIGPAELARRLGIRSASATALVDRLERGGHVERQRDSTDRRRIVIAVKPPSRGLIMSVLQSPLRAIDAVGCDLTAEESKVVVDYMEHVVEVIGEHSGAPATARRRTRP
jgi:DNA-binding MarR family transcriptional regulator